MMMTINIECMAFNNTMIPMERAAKHCPHGWTLFYRDNLKTRTGFNLEIKQIINNIREIPLKSSSKQSDLTTCSSKKNLQNNEFPYQEAHSKP